MAYRNDQNLNFLGEMTSKDLDGLVYCLTHDPKDGKVRLTEELTESPLYKLHHPDHHQY
jgi:hypothetical protein